ncbi:MAG: hypothetical protein ACLQU4_15775 [Limisphaerales bacterium]
MDDEDRKMEREWRMVKLTGGRGHPEGMVQITESRHRHKASEEANFNEQWKDVLQRQPPADRN